MNEQYDWDNPEIPVQQWVIAYHDGRYWQTIRLPGEEFMNVSAVEKVLLELNKKSSIAYSRVKQGCVEKGDRHRFKKGEFFGK